ncbi:MAG TPA: 23S rRNA (uracil(1939)-C(5))-methyltransferase RlmD [Kiritimatiellia bacterium]|nr:23S rRNA (uracil(1939)-C(5))-methyltransferase RlmD [Kiritimatiellia bacterium]
MNDKQFRKGSPLELVILDTAEDDACMAKLPGGMVVFVRGMIAPGDRVLASISKIKRNYLEARFDSLIHPSRHRTDPVCPHYGVCGGCKWQHVQYEQQLEYKQKVVQDALVRLGGFVDVEVAPPIASQKIYHYRNKVDFTFSNERFILDEEMNVPPESRSKPSDFALGFHRRGCFHKIIDIDTCHIASERSVRALSLTREFFIKNRRNAYSTISHEGFLRNLVLRHAETTDEFMINLITSEYDAGLMHAYKDCLLNNLGSQLTTLINSTTSRKNLVAYGEVNHVLHGPGYITELFDDLRFTVSPNSFFQTNSGQALTLYRVVMDLADINRDEVLFDLYCGTGSITLFGGRNCRAAYGFELEPSAVEDAGKNAELNGMTHCRFFATDMKHLRSAMEGAGERPDVVITDPPRAGMHADAVETVRSLAPKRIVYVSCHPGSLARDAKALCEGGMYELRRVQPVDLFPHTFHIESVACLHRIA